MLSLKRGALAALFAVVVAVAVAEETPVSAVHRQDILALLGRMETAFANADAHGLAACFSPGGEFVGPGGASANNREEIEKLFSQAFAAHKLKGKGATLHLDLQRFRLVNDSLALVDAISEMKPAEAAGGTPLVSFVIVRQDGRWLIESARETLTHIPLQTNHLKDLEWLIGDWTSTTSPAGITLRANCGWGANQAFLIRKFETDVKDPAKAREVFLRGGTEVIGWDPRAGTIRSWMFDSDGSFGENTWIRNGNEWLVKFSGTLADGGQVSATHVVSKVDDNSMTMQSKDRTINGNAQPDIPETTLSKQPPAVPAGKLPTVLPGRAGAPMDGSGATPPAAKTP